MIFDDMVVWWRIPGQYDAEEASLEAAIEEFDESKTVQSGKEEADINVIVKRFGITGVVPTNVRVPLYGDFTEIGDFREAQNAILLANASFMAMPAEVRLRFDNDPQAFLEFCSNPANLDEMRKLGLAVPAPVVDPPAPVVPPSP